MRFHPICCEIFFGTCAYTLMPPAANAKGHSFIGPLNVVSTIASTVPSNGDVNPYGTAVVPEDARKLHEGDVLVTNLNDSANEQGTGTTIIDIAPNGHSRVFAQITPAMVEGECPGCVGLTTALVVLRNRWVIVGSLPTSDGTAGKEADYGHLG